ncbi:response regulator [Candidatus Halocynthiibacter alkanivorans]|jgi:two-component system, NarL family, nitrate/nitrite response regulator NarL|uniref:response regulator transcription factor n=1 Tax=Candidatus Halocynthiibacter alkanivorans TaxID=2267619 RepID=UPI000DF45DA2|nr:response regulator transcription factor [Candidatus Halocynthiibacter alkanivorans]
MRILIADDHAMVLDMMAMLLSGEKDIEVVPCSDLPTSVALLSSSPPFDLVLLDYNMPGMNGLDGLQLARDAAQGCPVAIMSGVAPRSIAQEALDAGAAGFIPKTMPATSLINAVRFMMSGEQFAPVSMFGEDEDITLNPLARGLSPRELEVLDGVCRGNANKEIAHELDLQEVTIKLHMKNLCRKLDAKNRTHAAMIARDAGLF